MKILLRKCSVLAVIVGLFAASAINAQPPRKALERLEQFKKMKLIDILDMDEKTSEKFFAKYNEYDNRHEEKRKELQKTLENLKTALRYDSSEEELTKLTEKVIKYQDELHQIRSEKLKAMKSVLSNEQYSKFVLFEHVFIEEVRKRLHKFRNKKGAPMNENTPPGGPKGDLDLPEGY